MGSKVQAELGNAAEESLTIAPCLQHCPGLGFPIMAVPECVFFFPCSLERYFWFFLPWEVRWSQRQKWFPLRALSLPKGYPRLFSSSSFSKLVRNISSLFLSPKQCETVLLLSVQVCTWLLNTLDIWKWWTEADKVGGTLVERFQVWSQGWIEWSSSTNCFSPGFLRKAQMIISISWSQTSINNMTWSEGNIWVEYNRKWERELWWTKKCTHGNSLVVQWFRISLPMHVVC